MKLNEDLSRWLKAGADQYQVPGASIAVLRGGRVTGAAAGVINLDTAVPTTLDTVFQIGSITKIFTTTLIMQLVDEGRLDLDEPVVTYLPSFRVADLSVSRQVTPRHFLSHQSGIDGDFFVDAGRGDDSVEKLVEMAVMLPSLFAPGAKHSYCNLGFALLGRLAEVLTRRTYDELLRERIFEPLGMRHAISLPEDTLRFRSAIGHVPSRRKKNTWYVTRTPYLSHGQKAAGSTPAMAVTDLLKFAKMHMAEGRTDAGDRMLSVRSVAAMQKRQVALPAHTRNCIKHWGLGWFLMDWQGTRLYGHDGATMGQFAYLRVIPEQQLAVAMLTNGGDAGGLYKDIFDKVFLRLARTCEPAAPVAAKVSRLQRDDYVGSYANLNQRYDIVRKGETLLISLTQNGGGTGLPARSKLAFIDRRTAILQSGDPVLDRSVFHFSEPADTGYGYLATGLRQYRRT